MIFRFLSIASTILLTAISTRAQACQSIDPEKPDTVIVRAGDDATRRVRGKIDQWRGSALSLSVGERTRQIDNATIVSIETAWPPATARARELLAANSFGAAIPLLRQAIDEEPRSWAKNLLRSDLVRCYLANQQPAEAITHFQNLLADDPNTRHLNVAPLCWTGNTGAGDIVGRSVDWLKDKNAILRLLAASWLIDSPHEPAALTALDELSNDLDFRIAGLAAAQVWRTRTRINPKQLARWRQHAAELPPNLQAGPWFVLANHYAQQKQVDQATIAWMRIPILHSGRPDLAGAALYRAGSLLHNTNQQAAAEIVRRELLTDFPESSWAKQINSAGSP